MNLGLPVILLLHFSSKFFVVVGYYLSYPSGRSPYILHVYKSFSIILIACLVIKCLTWIFFALASWKCCSFCPSFYITVKDSSYRQIFFQVMASLMESLEDFYVVLNSINLLGMPRNRWLRINYPGVYGSRRYTDLGSFIWGKFSWILVLTISSVSFIFLTLYWL